MSELGAPIDILDEHPRMVAASHVGTRAPAGAVREDQPLEPRLRSQRAHSPLLGDRQQALQADLFARLALPYPRTIVLNDRGQVAKAAERLRFPVLLKPNVGGSGAGIVRFDSAGELESDGTVLLQEYLEPEDGAIVRVEVLNGEYLYAIRIVRPTDHFNLCPADLCRVAGAGRG